ncbi:MAG: hypothetical protein MJZ78_00330 [Bacteroidales bacterium]|nr:hypothetical protein [Bacteroidales bacterium]
MNSKKNHRFFKVATIILVVATVLLAVYIMANGLGLVDGLDFGAGAYFYADIPDYEKVDADGCFVSRVPRWIHFVLFFIWGALMFWLWNKIENRTEK